MEYPGEAIRQLLDSLTQSNAAFALYRLPWTDECRLVLQTRKDAMHPESIRQLGGERGFVMVPFHHTERHPPVVIRPDVTACGWKEIAEALPIFYPTEKKDFSSKETIFTQPEKKRGSSEAADEQAYGEAFARFIHPLRAGVLRKLVLSRKQTQQTGEGFSPLTAFVQACNRYPRMMTYLCHTPTSGTWMGSTPEILLSGRGRGWHTVALAGTMPMLPDGVMPTDWSEKNREEQACVAEYIRRVVNRYGSELTEEGPYTTRAGGLVHLKTDFRFYLNDPTHLGDLLQELHPTPAVCGLPKEEALQFILTHEGYDRSYYSGFIGWLDAQGQTDLYVNLRCMQLHDGEATLYAGGGILPQSDAASEWEETAEKMKTMKEVFS